METQQILDLYKDAERHAHEVRSVVVTDVEWTLAREPRAMRAMGSE